MPHDIAIIHNRLIHFVENPEIDPVICVNIQQAVYLRCLKLNVEAAKTTTNVELRPVTKLTSSCCAHLIYNACLRM